jgi:hypothetical protein
VRTAREALEAVAPPRGRIFSGFDYLKRFRAAARPVVGDARANYLTLRDLRHRCLTDIAEREGLAAAAYVGGHSSTEMAGRVYVSPQAADSAEAALRAREGRKRYRLRYSTNQVGERNDNCPGFLADAKGFEPPTSPSGGERSIQLSYASLFWLGLRYV